MTDPEGIQPAGLPMADNDDLVGILADNSSSLFSPVSGATPDEVARRRKHGEGLLTQGSAVAPLAHVSAGAKIPQ